MLHLTVNGTDVGPFIEVVLDRRHPERAKLHPTDATGFREAWAVIEQLWEGTVARASALEPALLHEQDDGEWSFIETLRHLIFATDAWIRRAVLGDPEPWLPRDRDAQPTLAEVLALRADRMATVRQVVGDLTDEQLAGSTPPVSGPGWPPESECFPVDEVLGVVINEEWWHRQFAERDLDALAARAALQP